MPRKPKIKKVSWYGFNHKKVVKHFEGDLSFVNEFSLKLDKNGGRDYHTVAVYKAKKPNRAKGHKKYMLLFTNGAGQMFVSGRSAREMNKERYQAAILCEVCNTVIYSVHRHDCHTCDCENQAMVDGGKDYLRSGAKDISKIRSVRLDLLTDTVEEYKK